MKYGFGIILERNTRYSVFVQNETQYLVDIENFVCYNW